jgi:hypothetical protein
MSETIKDLGTIYAGSSIVDESESELGLLVIFPTSIALHS